MNYTTFRTNIASWLNRSDMADVIPGLIRDAEARLNRDPRVRQISCVGLLPIVADGQTLPDDFRALASWYYDGPVNWGEIHIVPPGDLAGIKARLGATGIPRYASIADRRLYFAPAPGGEYNSRMSYYRRIPPLTEEEDTNWFLEEHPDLYRLAVLAEAAPYLHEDERIQVWETQLEMRLEDLKTVNVDEQFSGPVRRPIRRAIGG